MSTLPYMPLYVTDFLSDTLHLDGDQGWAYTLLLCHCWKHRAALDVDEEELKRIARWPSDKPEKAWKRVLSFFDIKDGKLHHARLEKELNDATNRQRIAVERAKKAAEARWQSNATSNARAMHEQCLSNANHSHKEKPNGVCGFKTLKPKRKGSSKSKNISYPSDFEEFWNTYPKKVGKGESYKSWNKLSPSSDLRQRILKAVEQQKRSYQWRRENGQFIPNPATWLNQGRWDDELDHVPTVEEMYGDGEDWQSW